MLFGLAEGQRNCRSFRKTCNELCFAAKKGARGLDELKKPGSQQKEEWTKTFRKMFSQLPDEFAEASRLAKELSTVFHSEMARELSASFNAHIQSLPQNSYDDKQSIATWANRELHRLHLAIRCPKSGKPALLIANYRQRGDDRPRFKIECRHSEGRTNTIFSGALPELELIEDPPRQEPLAREQRSDRGPFQR